MFIHMAHHRNRPIISDRQEVQEHLYQTCQLTRTKWVIPTSEFETRLTCTVDFRQLCRLGCA